MTQDKSSDAPQLAEPKSCAKCKTHMHGPSHFSSGIRSNQFGSDDRSESTSAFISQRTVYPQQWLLIVKKNSIITR